MALYLIATPIGNLGDITLRAVKALKDSDLIIGEERKVVSRLIKELQLGRKEIELLNEHSDKEDLEHLTQACLHKNVALVTDCGTPGFCDPGANLVKACRELKIAIHVLPGASCLMAFLSGCGEDFKTFYFRGFLPAKTEFREKELSHLQAISEPIVLMDTPYRLTKTLEDLAKFFPQRKIILALSLTQEDESFNISSAKKLLEKFKGHKKEFILAVI